MDPITEAMPNGFQTRKWAIRKKRNVGQESARHGRTGVRVRCVRKVQSLGLRLCRPYRVITRKREVPAEELGHTGGVWTSTQLASQTRNEKRGTVEGKKSSGERKLAPKGGCSCLKGEHSTTSKAHRVRVKSQQRRETGALH